MFWCWISNLFYKWDRIFYIFKSAKHSWVKIFFKILSRKWNKFYIKCQKHWIFCLWYFCWFWHVSSKSWTLQAISYVTSQPLVIFTLWNNNFNNKYFHSVKITACKDVTFIQCMDKMWCFTAENVIDNYRYSLAWKVCLVWMLVHYTTFACTVPASRKSKCLE